MSLIINNNLIAKQAARNLNKSYQKLAVNVQRLTSGLRINSAKDDAAGLAVREMMRADISTMRIGIRNASDGISMAQTADGAMGVIDGLLVRMKELAEQAATGTYTTAQRDIINSEYQAMASEIDRIANSTNFNGIKLLNGFSASLHGGQGTKIHFGTGNNEAEDYYYLGVNDSRATSPGGLRVGGDAKNSIWSQAAVAGVENTGPGCCTGGFSSLDGQAGFKEGTSFSYGYNWDWKETDNTKLLSGKYLAGRYEVSSTDSLSDLTTKVNEGTQSRVGVIIDNNLESLLGDDGTVAVCVGDEAYYWGTFDPKLPGAEKNPEKFVQIAGNNEATEHYTAEALAQTINSNAESQFWAMTEKKSLENGTSAQMVYIFSKTSGNHNNLQAGEAAGDNENSRAALQAISFEHVKTGDIKESGTNFSLGGENWARLEPRLNSEYQGNQIWNLTLIGRDVGIERDLWIANQNEISLPGAAPSWEQGLDRNSFLEIQTASDGNWIGADVRTQSAAQQSLEAITKAIEIKDSIRAGLGSQMNRLESTIDNLTVQMENLQVAESRISDVDIASEMSDFTKNKIQTEIATSILAQANSLSKIALTIITGSLK